MLTLSAESTYAHADPGTGPLTQDPGSERALRPGPKWCGDCILTATAKVISPVTGAEMRVVMVYQIGLCTNRARQP